MRSLGNSVREQTTAEFRSHRLQVVGSGCRGPGCRETGLAGARNFGIVRSTQFMLCEMLCSTAHPTPAMIAIITKNAATQINATAFSCSGLGGVIPTANIMPLETETRNRINMEVGILPKRSQDRLPLHYALSAKLCTGPLPQ